MPRFSRSTRFTVTKVRDPRVRVPRGYDEANIRWGGLVLALTPLVAVIAVAAGYAAADETRRPVLVVFAVALTGVLLTLIGGLAPIRSVRRGAVRAARSGPLRLVSRGYGGRLQLAAAACFGGAAALVARPLLVPGVPEVMGVFGSPASAIVLTLLALLVAGIAAFQAVEPPGLRLDEHGLWLQRHFTAHLLAWHDIERVTTHLDGNIASLEVHLRRGHEVRVLPQHFGSDAYLAAEIVSYFLGTPGARAALYDPAQALALVLKLSSD
ncbi:hypothetical protein ACXR2T_06835 [Leucobacter sp. HY1910]